MIRITLIANKNYMEEKAFEQLVESVTEGDRILKKEQPPSRTFAMNPQESEEETAEGKPLDPTA
jgi:hypothetical protein